MKFAECKAWINGVPVDLEDCNWKRHLSRRQRRKANLAVRRVTRPWRKFCRRGFSASISFILYPATPKDCRP